MASETWTVRRLLEWTEDFLRKKGFESPRLEAQILLAHALGCNKIDLYVRHTEEREQGTAFREMIALGRNAVAYLVGYREFYSSFTVARRFDSEAGDGNAHPQSLSLLKAMTSPHVLDMGTGSGCIAISIAKQQNPRITGRFCATVEVATANAVKHGLAIASPLSRRSVCACG
jgi:release factor glutamine methyltransferase